MGNYNRTFSFLLWYLLWPSLKGLEMKLKYLMLFVPPQRLGEKMCVVGVWPWETMLNLSCYAAARGPSAVSHQSGLGWAGANHPSASLMKHHTNKVSLHVWLSSAHFLHWLANACSLMKQCSPEHTTLHLRFLHIWINSLSPMEINQNR